MAKGAPQIKGPVADEKFVVCADVLGFKNLVATKDLSSLVQTFSNLVGSAQFAGHLDWVAGAADKPGQPRDDKGRLGAVINRVVYSDTVLLWTDDASLASFRAITKAACGLIAAGLLATPLRFPFRLGLARGEAHIEPAAGIFVGRALVEAYETEQLQNWFGGALSPLIADSDAEQVLQPMKFVTISKTEVPVHRNRHVGTWRPKPSARCFGKKTGLESLWAINWPLSLQIQNPDMLDAIFDELYATAGPHRPKHEAARHFFRKKPYPIHV